MSKKEKQRIAHKKHKWSQIQDGVLMRLHFDQERGGRDHYDRDDWVRGFSPLTGYGDALADINGNLLNTMQLSPKVMEHLATEAIPTLVQQLPEGLADYYDKNKRIPYMEAIALILWRLEQAPYEFDHFGDPQQEIKFRNHKNGRTKDPEKDFVIPIPLHDDKGKVVYDVRYHPDKKKMSYRFTRDFTGKEEQDRYRENHENDYYIDEKDGSLWKWKTPVLEVTGFNIMGYDIPGMRVDLSRGLVHPKDIGIAYSSVTTSSTRMPRNYMSDTMHIANLVRQYGPQDEHKLPDAFRINTETGRPYFSGALSELAKGLTRHENPARKIMPGIFLPDDGSKYDERKGHAERYDALTDLALRNHLEDIAPDIVSEAVSQANTDRLRKKLRAQDADANKPQIFAMPKRSGAGKPSDAAYEYIGHDDILGRFGKLLFIELDGNLEMKRIIGNKRMHEMSVDDWVEFFVAVDQQNIKLADTPIRVERFRAWKGALNVFDKVLTHSGQGAKYADLLQKIDDHDRVYLSEHPEIIQNIRQAISITHQLKNFDPNNKTELMEESWFSEGFAETYYLDPLDEAISNYASYQQAVIGQGYDGPREISNMLEMLKVRRDDDYEWMNKTSHQLMRLITKPHLIDYHQYDDIPEVFESYLSICESVYAAMKRDNSPSLKFIKPYFKSGKPKFKSAQEIREFRENFRQRILKDFKSAQKNIKGFHNGTYFSRKIIEEATNKNLLLIPTPSRGRRGDMPHIIDKNGHEISIHDIQKMRPADVISQLKNDNLTFRFHAIGYNPVIWGLTYAAVEEQGLDALEKTYRRYYAGMKQLYQDGEPTLDEGQQRWITRGMRGKQLRSLSVNAQGDSSTTRERANPELGIAGQFVDSDAYRQALGSSVRFHEDDMKNKPKGKDRIFTGHDPKTGLPQDHIPYLIRRNRSFSMQNDPNFNLIEDVPIDLLRDPYRNVEDPKYPTRLIVVPRPDDQVIKDIKAGKPVVFQDSTGRLTTPGIASIHGNLRSAGRDMADLRDKVKDDYARAGLELPNTKDAIIVGIEAPEYYIANSRPISPAEVSTRLPHMQFDALVDTKHTPFTSTTTATIIPADYVSQKNLTPDSLLRIYETAGPLFGNLHGDPAQDTGHVYDTKLTHALGVDESGKPKGIKLRDFFDKVSRGEIPSELMKGTQFQSYDHARQEIEKWARERWGESFMDKKILLLAFEQVRGKDWAYLNPPNAPYAAFTKDGLNPGPTSYQEGAMRLKQKNDEQKGPANRK